MAISNELVGMLDTAMDYRDLTAAERSFRGMLKMNLLGIAALQRSHWRQRARIDSIRDGDGNTAFLRSKAMARRRKKLVLSLKHNGLSVSGQQEKMDILWNHFNDLIGKKKMRGCRLKYDELGILASDLSALDNAFLEKEVRAALMEINPRKAPGPDRFTAHFFQVC